MRQVLETNNPDNDFQLGNFFLARMPTVGNTLTINSFASNTADLINPLSSVVVSNSAAGVTPALILTSTKCHMIWAETTESVNYASWSGVEVSPLTKTALPHVAKPGIGIGGCAVKNGATEYVVWVFVDAAGKGQVLVFADSTGPNAADTKTEFALTSAATHVAVSQNPRTGKIYFSYIANTNEAKVIPASLAFPGLTWTFDPEKNVTPINLVPSFKIDSAGLDNFENALGFRIGGSSQIIDSILRADEWKESARVTFPVGPPNLQQPTIFRGIRNDKAVLGQMTLYSGTKFSLKYRELVYPDQVFWDAANRVVYTEGPPFLNSTVTVHAVLPEMATSASRVNAVPAAGGRVAIDGANGVMIDAGNVFTLTFDKNMDTTQYNAWVGSRIRLFDALNGTIPVAYVNGGPASLSFQNTAALTYGQTYRVSIASDILDLRGNQLWTNATFTFTTQATSTPPFGFTAMGLFRNPERTLDYAPFEAVAATQTVYLRVSGADGATQTLDFSTATVQLPGGMFEKIPLIETASNSGGGTPNGYYVGTYTLAVDSFYGFPGPMPTAPLATITFVTEGTTPQEASLTVLFPEWQPTTSLVTTKTGSQPASGAANVLLDTNLTLSFSPPISSAAVTAAMLALSLNGSTVPATLTVSAAGNTLTVAPHQPLFPEATYKIIAPYAAGGLKNAFGNPLFRPIDFTFSTQASSTPPTAITSVNLYGSPSYALADLVAPNADFRGNGTVYMEMLGTDGSPQTLDFTYASCSAGGLVPLWETASNSGGKFRGALTLPGFAGNSAVSCGSVVSPGASAALLISYPVLAVGTPASGAVGESVFATVKSQSDEDLDPASVTSATVRLFYGGVPVPGTVIYTAATRQITFTPLSVLAYATTYTFEVNNVRDLVGNSPLQSLKYQFTTQNSTIPPTSISSLQAFASNTYTVELASNAAVVPAQEIFVEIQGIDGSSTTTDNTPVLMKSTSGASQTVFLIETGANTGVFRGSLVVFAEDNQTLEITSVANTTKRVTLVIPAFPKILSLFPASGSIDIPLDTLFRIQTSKNYSAGSVTSGTIRLGDSRGVRPSTFAFSNAKEFTVTTDLLPGNTVFLDIRNGLKDTEGLPFVPIYATFQTRSASYSQAVFALSETLAMPLKNGDFVAAGAPLWVKVLGTDLRTRTPETLSGTWSDGLATASFTLAETASGTFFGAIPVPGSPGKPLTVKIDTVPGQVFVFSIGREFQVMETTPASGAFWVSADIWPTWTFSRPVSAALLTDRYLPVRPAGGTFPVAGSYSVSGDGLQVTFKPQKFLNLLTAYDMIATSDFADSTGKTLGVESMRRFTIQGPPDPPSQVITLWHYRDETYAATSTIVPETGYLFLEVRAQDTSPSTIDSTWARIESSDGRMRGVDVQLQETANNSGVFRGKLKNNAGENASITVFSRADQNVSLLLKILNSPKIRQIVPASGSADLPLDRSFILRFSKALEAGTIATAVQVKSVEGVAAGFTATLASDATTLTVTPNPWWATATSYLLTMGTTLKDSEGVAFAGDTMAFSTRPETIGHFDWYSGLPPRSGQSAALFGEVIPGKAKIVASTTSMFDVRLETRQVNVAIAGAISGLTLVETGAQTGVFTGELEIPDSRGKTLEATLLFGTQATRTFRIALLPELLGVAPLVGATQVPEDVVLAASFSRPVMAELASQSLLILLNDAIRPVSFVTTRSPTTMFEWKPVGGLPFGATATILPFTVYDTFGQTVQMPQFSFSVRGAEGLQLFLDAELTRPFLRDVIEVPELYAEMSLNTAKRYPQEKALLRLIAQRSASAPRLLELWPSPDSPRKHRGTLRFEETRGAPAFRVPLAPGERIELTSPDVPGTRLIMYYLRKGNSPPLTIQGMTLYKEKFFAQKLEGDLDQASVFVEIQADDMNWVNRDVTRLRAYSDADPTGIEIDLLESDVHSGRFWGQVTLAQTSSFAEQQRLKARPGDRISLQSVTNPAINASTRWKPVTQVKNLTTFPSPARGDFITFSFYLTFPSEVELFIYDTSGDELYSVFVYATEGENRLTWRFPSRLANGVYFYTLEILSSSDFLAPKKKLKGKFAVLR
jgi:hypothetical protein